VLRAAVDVLVHGEAVAIPPVNNELTTQEAADILNVSRQYLVRLLDQGKIPFSRTGTHRRIKFGDLIEYKRRRDADRRNELDELTRLSQELRLYD
jgi:excisionase family DNA binding protein